jgi:hypothetical protein
MMAVGHLWQGRQPPHPSVSPPSLPSFLFKPRSSSRSPLCTRNTPTRALEAPPSHSTATSSSPPLGKLIAGEGLPLLSLSSSLVFLPAFTEPTMPQVRALEALRSCALITQERRPTRRHRTPSPPSPLRLWANHPAPFSYAQQQLHGLAGEADPPPSGAGHRGRSRLAPDLLGVCPCFLSSCKARACTKWCHVRQSRVLSIVLSILALLFLYKLMF